MKKILVVTALALLIALAVAGPAVAFPEEPADGAWVWPFDGGSWVMASGGAFSDTWNDPGTPIPAGTDVYVGSTWMGYTKGLMKTVPQVLFYKVSDVTDAEHPVTSISFAQGVGCWNALYTEEGLPSAFNPRIGAVAYLRDWWSPELTPGQSGTYHWLLTEKFRHTTTDLMSGWYDGQFKPFMIRAGLTEYPFLVVIAGAD